MTWTFVRRLALTPREVEVLHLLSTSMTLLQIAGLLYVSRKRIQNNGRFGAQTPTFGSAVSEASRPDRRVHRCSRPAAGHGRLRGARQAARGAATTRRG
jgi:hypothetical protein